MLKDACQEILKSDSKIRFAGIYHHSELTSCMREGTAPLLTELESVTSIRGSVIRWGSRKLLKHKLGYPRYALALYDDLFRVTFPLTNDDLLLVSIDSDCNITDVISQIIPLQQKLIQELSA